MVITDFLEKNARFRKSQTALVEINPSHERDKALSWRELSLIDNSSDGSPYRREISWGAFDMMSNMFANFLLSRNVKRGEKVAILMMNCLEFLPIYFGILKAGCVAVPMNYRYSGDEIDYCLRLADASVLVFGPEFTERLQDILPKWREGMSFLFAGRCAAPAFAEDLLDLVGFCSCAAPPVKCSEDDKAAIYFSSGTTGFPKAVLHNHRSLVHSCFVEQNHHGQTENDVFLLIPPLYHTGAKMHWFGSLISGSKAVILKGTRPEWIMRAVTEERCTIVWLLVPWMQDILDAIESGKINMDEHYLEQWRLTHVGAQPVPPSLIRRWLKRFPNHEYDTNYGLTESLGPGCVHLGVGNVRKVGAIGVPGFGWEAIITDENGNETKTGEVGELRVRGPSVMMEYYKDPKATAEALRDGWLLTGDMAKRDGEGFIYLVDRKKDVIISGGENLYPVEIEDFIRKFDKVKDVAVIGMPDPRLGERAVAIVELKEGCECSKEEINDFCLSMARYKRPRDVFFDSIPRNPTGKIEKPALRSRYNKVSLVEAQTKA